MAYERDVSKGTLFRYNDVVEAKSKWLIVALCSFFGITKKSTYGPLTVVGRGRQGLELSLKGMVGFL